MNIKQWKDIDQLIIFGVSTATGFAFPSFALQIPLMDNVISFLNNGE